MDFDVHQQQAATAGCSTRALPHTASELVQQQTGTTDERAWWLCIAESRCLRGNITHRQSSSCPSSTLGPLRPSSRCTSLIHYCYSINSTAVITWYPLTYQVYFFIRTGKTEPKVKVGPSRIFTVHFEADCHRKVVKITAAGERHKPEDDH